MKSSDKSVSQCVARVERTATEMGFGVLHEYDFREILTSKGFQFARECRVLELCNPAQANRILDADIEVNMALPCRISVYQGTDGRTRVGMIRPTALVHLISEHSVVREAAEEVDRTMTDIIDRAV